MDNLFDDPVDDLLSEGSNDSFFGDLKPKQTTKQVSTAFDIDEESKPEPKKEQIPLDSIAKTSMESVNPVSRERKFSLEKSDVTDLLGTQEKKKSKASVMNEILGISGKEESKVFTFDDILKSSNISKKETPKQPESEISSILNIQPPKEARKGRRGSANLDPLGLLDIVHKKSPVHESKQDIKENIDLKIKPIKSATTIQDEKSQVQKVKSVNFLDSKETSLFSEFSGGRRRETVKKSPESDLPDWLRGSGGVLSQTDSGISTDIHSVEKISSSETVNVSNQDTTSKIIKDPVSTKLSDEPTLSSIPPNMIESLLKQQKLASSTMEIQNSSLVLQQQESQLMIALQLKKYEQNLADMQKMQQDILTKQEQQFNMLIEKQFSKQQVIEENMRLQQERINQHIQLLLSQPVSSGLKQSIEEHHKKEDLLKETFEENRAFYGDVISSLKQKHQEEIVLLEDSYKKQLSFLEMSLESTESRLKNEIDSLNNHYRNKLVEVSTKQAETIDDYEEKIKKINEQNNKMIEDIKSNYEELLREIKNEYKLMIEDIGKSKNKEEEVINKSGVFTDKLNSSIELLVNNTVIMNELKNSAKSEKDLISDLKIESLSIKEKEIKMMQASLEKQRSATENERAQLLALVKTLEGRLMEQTQAAREERWALQQATAAMAARALAMDKEIEFLKNNLEFEREQLKNLKETHLAEHEKVMEQLTEQKLAIVTEKSRLETAARLNQNYDINKGKAEIEAALQVAKEATELTDNEREKLCRKQCELEILKRSLVDRERKLQMKEHEIENVAKMAEQKYRDGEKALLEARTIENRCSDRLKDIQRHSSSLAIREKKLAEDKIALSKERLSLHNRVAENQCGLCRVGSHNASLHEDAQENVVEQDLSDSYRVQDMELLRLKSELEDTVPTSVRDN